MIAIDRARALMRMARATSNDHEADAFRSAATAMIESLGIDAATFDFEDLHVLDLGEVEDQHDWPYALGMAVATMNGLQVQHEAGRLQLIGSATALAPAKEDFLYYAEHAAIVDRLYGPSVAFGYAMGLYVQACQARKAEAMKQAMAAGDFKPATRHAKSHVQKGVEIAMMTERYTVLPKLTGTRNGR